MPAASEINFTPMPEVDQAELQSQSIYISSATTITSPSEVTSDDVMNVIEASGTLDFWSDMQRRIKEGEIVDITPYDRKRSFFRPTRQ